MQLGWPGGLMCCLNSMYDCAVSGDRAKIRTRARCSLAGNINSRPLAESAADTHRYCSCSTVCSASEPGALSSEYVYILSDSAEACRS